MKLSTNITEHEAALYRIAEQQQRLANESEVLRQSLTELRRQHAAQQQKAAAKAASEE